MEVNRLVTFIVERAQEQQIWRNKNQKQISTPFYLFLLLS